MLPTMEIVLPKVVKSGLPLRQLDDLLGNKPNKNHNNKSAYMKRHLSNRGLKIAIGMTAAMVLNVHAETPKSNHRIAFVAGAGGYAKMAITNQTFFDALTESGYIKDENLEVVFRTAEGDMKKMPSLVKEVLAENVEILVVSSSPGCAAAKAQTQSVPVLCISVQDDPVKEGLTSTVERGSGNLVGVHSYLPNGIAEQLNLLIGLQPKLSSLAVLYNPENATHIRLIEEWRTTAQRKGIEIVSMPVVDAAGLDQAIIKVKKQGAQLGFALLGADTYAIRGDIAKTAIERNFPIAMDTPGGFTEMGGVASVGVDIVPLYRRGAVELMIPMLQGKHPSSLPWVGPSDVAFKVNKASAEQFGLNH